MRDWRRGAPAPVRVYNARKEFPPWVDVGLPEMLVILAIVIIIFGANRLPQLGRGIGSAIKNFKEGIKVGRRDDHDHKA